MNVSGAVAIGVPCFFNGAVNAVTAASSAAAGEHRGIWTWQCWGRLMWQASAYITKLRDTFFTGNSLTPSGNV